MGVLKNPCWFVPFILLVGHQLVQYGMGWNLAYVDAYLDPLVSIPVLLGLLLIERKFLFGVRQLTGLEVIVTTLTLSLVFEELFPRFEPAFYYDAYDYFCYGLGGWWYWEFVNGSTQDTFITGNYEDQQGK